MTTTPLDPAALEAAPIPMLLFCPHCGYQHVDSPEPARRWTNPPHKSHLCHACKTIWRPADVPTIGVAQIATKGSADTWTLFGSYAQTAKAATPAEGLVGEMRKTAGRLRHYISPPVWQEHDANIVDRAADALEAGGRREAALRERAEAEAQAGWRLRAESKRLRGALEKLVRLEFGEVPGEWHDSEPLGSSLTTSAFLALEEEMRAALAADHDPVWECAARKHNAGPNAPRECNWPVCGCDPYANKVLAALEENTAADAAGGEGGGR